MSSSTSEKSEGKFTNFVKGVFVKSKVHQVILALDHKEASHLEHTVAAVVGLREVTHSQVMLTVTSRVTTANRNLRNRPPNLRSK